MKGTGIQIFEQKLDGGKGTLSIICGGLNAENPKSFMDEVVSRYVKEEMYNEFIEIFLDNPYVRVIITGINEIEFKEFDKKTHLLKTLRKRLKSEENAKAK